MDDHSGVAATARTAQVILPDGRRLGFSRFGTPGGRPVMSFHGALSCRVEMRFADSLCEEMGVRLIAPDRPGIGLSDFQAGRRLLDWPEDIAALADLLGIQRFAVLGWSAGGPYALACAHAIPQRVSRAASVSGMAPINKPGAVAELGLSADRILFPLSARWPRIAGLLLSLSRLQPARMVRRSLLTALSGTGDPDAEFLASLPLDEVSRFYFESLRSGGRGTAHDYRILGGDWGFPLDNISTEVLLWHGENDGLLPLSHAQRLAEQLPRARLVVVPGRGHFLPRRHLRRILSQLLESSGCPEK